jgi:hypothetical protein
MEFRLKELFPELSTRLNPEIYSPTAADLESNTYFRHLVSNIVD